MRIYEKAKSRLGPHSYIKCWMLSLACTLDLLSVTALRQSKHI